jgi:hypothetical protein
MPRCYRGIVVAVAGLILSAAQHPNAKAEPQQPSPEERSARALENISARYDEQTKGAERSRETEPCENGDDKRYSDLCAQWKAADSAQLAAWLSGASFAAVLIALYLAFRSNGIARDTAKHQLRAYLAVKPMGINLLIGSHKVIGQVALENMGSTPAYNVSLKVRMDICDEKDRISFEFPEDIEKTDRAVHPGLQMPQGSFDNPNLSKINMAGKYAYVWGVVYYSDAFWEATFHTLLPPI